YAALFVIASSHINRRDWRIPALLVIAAIAFNANALIGNLPKMIEKKQGATVELQELLLNSGKRANAWEGVLLRHAISADIYRPLQNHDSLPIAQALLPIENCPQPKDSYGKLKTETNDMVAALNVEIQLSGILKLNSPQLFLCGSNKKYKITLGAANLNTHQTNTLTILLDKRKITPDTYRVVISTGNFELILPEQLSVTAINPWHPNQKDCKAARFFARWKAFSPFVEYYCSL
ncbi:MAG TPA: hypothetical protein PLH12_05450, partial [Pseudomonadales bacterium]|nr:hypothetical protein [Pseudomonadales bacterium]